jgi:class 3 adenylate cyclase/tetratricopeptide (TPR) repeat protein
MSNCSRCEAELPEAARFCPSCGQRVVPAVDERRIATVLFGDIAGFTTMSESMDPEQVKELVDTCLERLARVVERYGGTVDKIVGDAIVGVFGAPIAHEDDAERAVRAALEMQEEVARFTEETEKDIRFKVGVNTGEVLVGALRAGDDYTTVGDATNVAARLESAASPGEVLVGPLTWAATKSAIEYVEKGALSVKGRKEPVKAWVALCPILQPGEKRHLARTRFVGRESEVALVTGFLERVVAQRRAGLCVITGEAGVGKSRLAREIAELARSRFQASTLEGRCAPYGETSIWAPITGAIRKYCGIETLDSLEEVAEKCRKTLADIAGDEIQAAEIGMIADSLANAIRVGPLEHGRSATSDDLGRAVRSFLSAISTSRPVVLTLSDLHWADDAVVDFVSELVSKTRDAPLMVIAVGRDELWEMWSPTEMPKNLVAVSLEPLESTAAKQLIEDLLQAKVDDELLDFFLARCQGNPFYIEEMVGFLAQRGALDSTEGKAVLTFDTSSTDVPDSLRGLVSAHIDSLEDSERAVLQDAAVIGRQGSCALVGEVANRRGGVDVGQALEGLEGKGLLSIDGNEYTFRSELARSVTYGQMTKADRARRHLLVAHAYAGVGGEGNALTGAIGNLFGEEAERVAFHSREAARLASEIGSIEGIPEDIRRIAALATIHAAADAEERDWPADAERLYSLALEYVEPDDDRTRLQVLLGLARAQLGVHAAGNARPNIERALELASLQRDERSLAEAKTSMARLAHIEGDLDRADTLFSEAVESWNSLGDPRAEAMARRSWAESSIIAGRYQRAVGNLTTALEIFEEVGDVRGRAWALQNLAWSNFLMGDLASSDRYASESLDAFGRLGDTGGLGWALGMLAWTRFGQGRRKEAETLARTILEQLRGRREEQAWATAIMEILLSMIELSFGRVRAALELAESADRTMGELEDGWGRSRAQTPKLLSLCWLGKSHDFHEATEAAAAIAYNLPDRRERAFVHAIAAACLFYMGDAEAALAHVGSANELLGSDARLLGSDLSLSLAGGLLMESRGEEALGILEEAVAKFGTENQGLVVVQSLTYSFLGMHRQALETAETAIGTEGWFHSTALAHVAHSIALAAIGESDAARSAAGKALEVADDSDAELAKAIVHLGCGAVSERLGDPASVSTRAEAHRRFGEFGRAHLGWERIFRTALGLEDRDA